MTTPGRPASRGLGTPLTDREINVLYYLVAGLSMSEIAREMHYSEDRIKDIMRTVRRRLGAVNSANAIYLAMRKGIIK